MSLTIKHHRACKQMADAAELERRASLARMADRMDDPDAPARMLGYVILFVLFVALGALLYALPAIVKWMVLA